MKHYFGAIVRRALGRAPASVPATDGSVPVPLAELIRRADKRWRDAKAAARDGGRKVVIATNVTGFQHATLLESVLAVALTLRGADVHLVICDGVLPGCLRAEPDNVPDPKLFINYEVQARLCRKCMATGENLMGPLELVRHRFSELIDPTAAAEARHLATTLPAGELRSFTRNGLHLGEHAYAGALRYFARGNIDGLPDGEIVVRRYFEAALLTASAAETLLNRHQFASACFHHGIYVPQGPFGEVCRANGVPVVNWNPSYRQNTFIFSHGDTYHHTLMDEPVGAWKNIPWTEEMSAEIDAYLASRRSGTRDWIWFHEKPDENFSHYAAEVGLRLDRPIIGMLTNVMWDAQLHYPANAFPDMLDWTLKTIAYFARRPDLQLLIRVHPAEIRGTVPSRQPLAAEIARAFPELPANVFIIAPDSNVSTYAAMDVCNAVIIYGTKTGVELTSAGTPVIVGGEAWIRNKGLTLDASSEEEYFKHLDRLPFPARMDEAAQEEAKKYAYHFFFRRMVPLPFIVPQKGKIYELSIDDIGELGPGRHPGLDVICDGILSGAPFIYPAEIHGLHDR